MHTVRSGGRKHGLVHQHRGLRCALVAMIFGLCTTHALGQCVEDQKLTASAPGFRDRFGRSVSLSGNAALVGAPWHDGTAGSLSGAAYMFRLEGSSWVEEQKLTAFDGQSGAQFGQSVSVSGDTGIVGAWLENCVSGSDCGAAYVFRFDGTSWVEEQKLTASDAAGGDEFGRSVSVSADTAVVGATFDDCAAGIECGSAYVFRFNGSTWAEEQKLTASDAATDNFGISVAVRGETAVVGARYDDCAVGVRCGSAYVFRFNGAAWVEEQKLTASDATAGARFGEFVSLDGGTALVGARNDACMAGTLCGSAYVFGFNGSSWDEEQKLTASDAAPGDRFGISVSVGGDTAVVGAYEDDCSAGSDCGATYVFRFDGTSWLEEKKLAASDAGEDDLFGSSVSLSGNTVLVGAVKAACAAGGNCGSAYVYDVSRCVRPPTIPAASGWSLMSLILLLLATGTIVIRGKARAAC